MKYSNLGLDEIRFKKVNGDFIDDIFNYIKQYYSKSVDLKIIVGCDSQSTSRCTQYAIVLVLYDEFKRNGGHILFIRKKQPKEKDIFTRMYNEAMYSLDLAEYINEGIKEFYNKNIMSDDVYSYDKKVEIHCDVNSIESKKSNVAYKAIVSTLSSLGYKTICKPNSYAASNIADFLVR